jgi:hypothetical protein
MEYNFNISNTNYNTDKSQINKLEKVIAEEDNEDDYDLNNIN